MTIVTVAERRDCSELREKNVVEERQSRGKAQCRDEWTQSKKRANLDDGLGYPWP
jgi:hypothetical protein